ncbi:MAG: T9SS type A sorting domain-containing protein [Candidatus Eisenbacteria bacterium]|uniref:T9SS type A sorting domain-containing protein n=1 Tax=Eiseniibacteriota bacterium TaxID=2212470 RepID=A0A538T8M0_UNCEI|nr:MAG: T9SS type A sorting domain-containing protein [Candidatus Eisenbacteria bacterium]
MDASRRSGFLLGLLLLAFATFLAAGVASAVPSWGPDQDISDGDVNDTFTSSNGQRFIAVDDSNNLYVAFFDNRFRVPNGDNNFEIFFRRFIYNFGSPFITRVTNAGNMSKFPAIAIRNWGAGDFDTQQDSGRVYIVWQDARLFSVPLSGEPKSYTIFMRTFRSMGGTGLGPELQVSPYDSINAATLPVCTVGDSNRVWIVWQKPNDGTGSTALYSRVYHSNTAVLDPVVQLTSGVTFSGNASIAASRDGVVHLAWVDTRSGLQQIWTKRFVPGSGWTADQQVVFSSTSSSAPSITADWHNHMHLVWVDTRDGNNEIYYKEYVPGVGWAAVDTRVTANASSQIQPFVDADPIANVYTVWTDLRNGSSNPDIFYDTRQGGTWVGNTPLVYAATDTSNSVQRFPGIAHDDFGTAYVAWSDERLPASLGKNKDVFYKVGLNVITAVSAAETPGLSRLLRNYPNPFNPSTKVQFVLDRNAQVSLRVFDVQGRAVRSLVNSYLTAGTRLVSWDGRDDNGRQLSSGTYFLRLEGGGTYLTRTVSLVK